MICNCCHYSLCKNVPFILFINHLWMNWMCEYYLEITNTWTILCGFNRVWSYSKEIYKIKRDSAHVKPRLEISLARLFRIVPVGLPSGLAVPFHPRGIMTVLWFHYVKQASRLCCWRSVVGTVPTDVNSLGVGEHWDIIPVFTMKGPGEENKKRQICGMHKTLIISVVLMSASVHHFFFQIAHKLIVSNNLGLLCVFTCHQLCVCVDFVGCAPATHTLQCELH